MIETKDLRVDYDGVTAVHDLTLTIPQGEVFGLIGPNGAGKTSTIRVMATLLEPTYGEVRIAGIDVALDPVRAHGAVGYMPDMPPVEDDLRCWEFLDLFASAYGMARRDRQRRIAESLEQVNLSFKRNAMAGTLSRGMKQRLVLAKTIIADPKVLLLDEPASGLDPIARIELRDALIGLSKQGRTILVSSHILTELSEFCTSVGVMQKGAMLEAGPIDEVVGRLGAERRIVIEVLDRAADLASMLEKLDDVPTVEHAGARIQFDFAGTPRDAAALLARIVGEGYEVTTFHERKRGVEDVMLSLDAREVS